MHQPLRNEHARRTRAILRLACVVWPVLALIQVAQAQDEFVSRESQIKAAYLYKFCFYVTWPDSTDKQPPPLVIGTVGTDPVNRYLQIIAQKRTISGRKLIYREVTTGEQAKACHLLFVSDSAKGDLTSSLLKDLQGTPILLVGDSAEFLEAGGTVGFITSNNRVRFRLSLKHAANQQLRISSQLAKLADYVERP